MGVDHLRGVFVNYPMPSLSTNEYPGEYWGENVARLVELKQRFDPFHVLRYNQNVPFVLNHSSFKGDDVSEHTMLTDHPSNHCKNDALSSSLPTEQAAA